MTQLDILVRPGASLDELRIQSVGKQDLNQRLGGGGIIAGMDAWLSGDQRAAKTGYNWKWGSDGPCRAYARPDGTANASVHLSPEALADHVWDNLQGDQPVTFSTSLQRSVELTSSVEVSTEVTASVSITANVELEVPGEKGGVSSTVSLSATQGKKTTNTRSQSLGTTDSAEETIQPGHAALLVLVAEVGSITAQVPVITTWEGTILWQYKDEGSHWRELDVSALQNAGLRRPGDVGSSHNGGHVTINLSIGSAGETDQKSVAITSTDPDAISSARKQAVSSVHGKLGSYGYRAVVGEDYA